VTKLIVLAVIAIIAAAAWVYSPYCADNDIEAAKQAYASCMERTLSSGPMCARASTEMSCKRWARW
jgi:hypothetical protein